MARKVKSHDGRVVGEVREGVFIKKLRAEHFLKYPPAIAFDTGSLNDAEDMGAETVRVHDLDNDVVYEAPIDTIWDIGIPINRGHGAQIALALDRWRKIDQKQGGLF